MSFQAPHDSSAPVAPAAAPAHHRATRLLLAIAATIAPSALALGAALAAAACAADSPRRTAAERTDSAGVAIITNRGADFILDWSFTPTLTLGGEDEGPESFFNIGQSSVATDADGNIYIMDAGNHRVVVFDGSGHHLRTLGRKGGGPGEFQMWPSGITIARDGSINVYDIGKQGLVRFDPAGNPLQTRRIEGGQLRRYALLDHGIAIHVDHYFDDVASDRIQTITDAGDTTTIVSITRPPLKPVDFGCVRISGMATIFAPSLQWDVLDDHIVINPGAEYVLDLYEGARRVASIRRDLPPRPATRELALRQVGDDFKVTFGGGGECKVPAARVVDERGIADFLPAISRIRVAPNGTTWVQRFAIKNEPAPIDIFKYDGEYLGTLPEDTPFPAAFLPGDRIAAIEKDEFDLQRVVVYQIDLGRPAAR
jgi:hypothetical protein